MPATLTPSLSVNGSPLEPSWLAALVEVKVEHEFQVPGQCQLRFVDPGYELISADKLQLGTEIDIREEVLGGNGTELITAEVTSIAVDQRTGEQPELVVVAHDRSHRMGRGTRIKSYLQVGYSDIATQLASTYGLIADVDSTDEQFDYLMQRDSDLAFLSEIARRVGYDWWVMGTTLHFKRPAQAATVHLSLGAELRSFSVRAAGHLPGSVTVDGWDRGQQAQVTSTATSATSAVTASSQLADLVTSAEQAFGTAQLLTAAMAAQSQAEATQVSQAMFDRARASSVTARGVADGNGAVALGAALAVAGAGPLSGTYPVTRVEHIYRAAAGFTTRFTSGDRRPTSLVDTLGGSRREADLHPGLSVGVVTNINDPDSTGRVKVRFPGVSNDEESDWARVAAVGGGASRGNVFIPEVNDEVLVGFEGGDPRQPVVIGGLYGSKSTIPATAIANGQVQSRGMTSRLGHVVRLMDGDEPAAQGIVLLLAGQEHKVSLSKEALDVEVPAGTPVTVAAGTTSIKFGQDGSLSLQAPSISITADQQVTLSAPKIALTADAQLDLEGQATAALKGSVVQVNGSGPVTIAGTPVAIN